MEDPAESKCGFRVSSLGWRCGSSALELWTKKLNRNNTATCTLIIPVQLYRTVIIIENL